MEKLHQWKLSTRLLLLFGCLAVGFVVGSVIGIIVLHQSMLAMLTAQDVFAFIIPAIVAMALCYRRPLHAMCLDRAPSWQALVLVVIFYIVSLPGMNWLVSLNETMTLPSWMSGIEQWMRASEDQAMELTKQLLDIHTAGELIACLLVVGLMAGMSEEMLFRGAMQRMMHDSRLGIHPAVWIVAIIFSAFHLQFYGFVPRVVLGLWLGYLLVWTRSLWVPIIAHTLNNSTVIMFSYLTNKGVVPEGFGDHFGIPADGGRPWLAVCSIIASICIAVWAHRRYTAAQPSPATEENIG